MFPEADLSTLGPRLTLYRVRYSGLSLPVSRNLLRPRKPLQSHVFLWKEKLIAIP